jgi:hypothetical protein
MPPAPRQELRAPLPRAPASPEAAYGRCRLRRESRGLARGDTWPCDPGPDLSRGVRALKVRLTPSVSGTDALGGV